ncbi:MAG: MurR/RpiR family transcriptional regulator [Clostridia bacterium]|nr:MurR/RpiR family transcriptional regulator [Clostridia bacterium]
MSDHLFTLLTTQYDCLTKTEKKIASLLLEKPEEFMEAYIPELAEQIGVSQGSLHNFAKKMGCEGFAALKLRIARDLKDYRPAAPAESKAQASLKDHLQDHIRRCNKSMADTYDLNSENALRNAIDLILSANRIQLHGVYHSGIAAQDFCYQLIQMGLPATFISDPLISAVSATMLDQKSLVIAVSASGRTKEILDTAAFAKEKGASILAITAHRFSPLAKMADTALITAAGDAFSTGRFNQSRTAQLFAIDALCSYLHLQKINSESSEEEQRINEILSSHNVYD